MADEAPGTNDRSAAEGHREELLPIRSSSALRSPGWISSSPSTVVGLFLIALTGGVDLGVVSVHGAAKSLLMLVLLVPLRMAVGGRSWLADLTNTTVRHVTPWLENWSSARVPAAVIDSAFAMLVVLGSVCAGRISCAPRPGAGRTAGLFPAVRQRTVLSRSLPPGTPVGTGMSPPAATISTPTGRAVSPSFPCTRC